ncbi:MAG: glutamate synthase subunit beta [Chloroflexota bacterium]
MAKPTGFMEFERELPADRPVDERIKDWQPIHLHLSDDKLNNQAARCMDCGTPFCHKGRVINRMNSGCPINNLIPEWNDLVYQGLWKEAYQRLEKTNNFPEFTGLVCPAPCEAACTLGINEPPVTIKNIEYSIIEKAFQEGWVTPQLADKPSGKTVAVVGSGPAGLACADQLNKVGHQVTVFERADRIGGLLMYGIPNMKLDKEVVQRRIDFMAAAGINFVTNTEIGVDISADALKAQYDAVVLCTGAVTPRDLPIPGRDLDGIHFAMDYLQPNTQSLLDGTHDKGKFLSAKGKDVIIIGGGDTGTDCVATALRHGCKSLTQFEIMDRPPNERGSDNPWPQWPLIYKLDYGQEEAAVLFGDDPRRYGILSRQFVGDDGPNGVSVTGVETVLIKWEPDGSGRPFTELPGTEKRYPAQMVLLAMGFMGPDGDLLDRFKIEKDERSNAKAEYGNFQTSAEGVFAAGDARRGQSLVVWAINEGRGAAREVDSWLMGETDLP